MIIEKSKAYISIIIYLRNIIITESVYENLYNHINNSFENFEFIFINDNLPTDFIKSFKKILTKNFLKSTSLINQSFEQGIEKSMYTAVELSLGDFVFEIDYIDAIKDTNLFTELFDKIQDGNDIVLMRSIKTKLTSQLFYLIFNSFSNSQYKIGSDYMRVLSRRAINRIRSLSSFIPYRKANYSHAGLKTKVIISKSDKIIKSSLNKDRNNVGSTAIVIFTNFALKFSLTLAFLFMILTFLSSIYTIAVFLNGQPLQGYTTIMLLISGSFFGVFSMLAIIVKYLSILIELVFSKQTSVLESTEKIS